MAWLPTCDSAFPLRTLRADDDVLVLVAEELNEQLVAGGNRLVAVHPVEMRRDGLGADAVPLDGHRAGAAHADRAVCRGLEDGRHERADSQDRPFRSGAGLREQNLGGTVIGRDEQRSA